MTVRFLIKEYIQELSEQEQAKPAVRRKPIPTPQDMAAATGMNQKAIYNFLNRSEHRQVNLRVLDALIKQFRTYGHNTTLDDLLVYDDD